MSGLIWIQSVWHTDGIPVRIFQKSWFRKKTADDKKAGNISQDAKVNDIKARYYSKTVLKATQKEDKKLVFKTDYRSRL